MEFDHYIDKGVLKRNENFDILPWWKNNGLTYPTLQRISKDILAILFIVITLDSTFSISGRLLNPN